MSQFAKHSIPIQLQLYYPNFSYLLPERSKSGKQKTSVCRRTLNPKWEHTVTWESVSLHELAADRSLEITVWDHDRLGHSELLGGLRFNLGNGELGC